MELEEPELIYTAVSNEQANHIVDLLANQGIQAHVIEDVSNLGFFPNGSTQIVKPYVFVEKYLSAKAAKFIEQYEYSQLNQKNALEEEGEIEVVCDECGEVTRFSKKLNGTTQDCPRCKAYMDVGDLPWEEDWGEPEE